MTLPLLLNSPSPESTAAAGRAIAECLVGGEWISLVGDLGAGKTCFVRGLASGLDIAPELVYSPSFTLVALHSGRLELAHVDLFRLPAPVSVEDAEAIGLEDLMSSNAVTAIEWFDHLESPRPADIEVCFDSIEGDRRDIRIECDPARREPIRSALESAGLGLR